MKLVLPAAQRPLFETLVGKTVELRFDPERPAIMPQVFDDGEFVCDAAEIDLVHNSRRRRRRLHTAAPAEPAAVAMPSDIDRFSGLVARPTTASTTPKPVPAMPNPIRMFKS